MKLRRLVALTAAAACLLTGRAAAIPIDGQLDGAYGPALVTQITQTGLSNGQIAGDNTDGDLNFANGSELDGAFATVSGGVLYLFLAGNVAMELNVNQNRTVGHVLDLFVDSVTGGQNSLNGLGAGNPLNGLTFDAGFEADYWLEYQGDAGGSHGTPSWTASSASLPSGGGGTLTSLGTGTAGGPGTLTGGTNPFGILVTIDNRNTAGVTYGCAASSGAGVASGIEWAIPLAAIGNPSGCFRFTILVREPGTSSSPVSNQVLGPVPPGTCPLGSASTVNLATIAGDQFVSVCSGTAVPGARSPGLALLGAWPNPGRGDVMRVAFQLSGAEPAVLRMVDCAGRVVRERSVGASSAGRGMADLSAGRRLPVGMYWLILSEGTARVTRGCTVLR